MLDMNTLSLMTFGQGGRDNKNNIIPDQEKFPTGLKHWLNIYTQKA